MPAVGGELCPSLPHGGRDQPPEPPLPPRSVCAVGGRQHQAPETDIPSSTLTAGPTPAFISSWVFFSFPTSVSKCPHVYTPTHLQRRRSLNSHAHTLSRTHRHAGCHSPRIPSSGQLLGALCTLTQLCKPPHLHHAASAQQPLVDAHTHVQACSCQGIQHLAGTHTHTGMFSHKHGKAHTEASRTRAQPQSPCPQRAKTLLSPAEA